MILKNLVWLKPYQHLGERTDKENKTKEKGALKPNTLESTQSTKFQNVKQSYFIIIILKNHKCIIIHFVIETP